MLARALEHGDPAHAVEGVGQVNVEQHFARVGSEVGGGGVQEGRAAVAGADANLERLEVLARGGGVLAQEDAGAEAAQDLPDGDGADATARLGEAWR